MRVGRFVALGLILVAAACASAGGGGGGGGGGEEGSTDRYLITGAELQPYATLSVYEAIRRLRRFWLQGSGGRSPRAFVNDREMGGAQALDEYRSDQVAQIRFIQPTDAMTQFGPDYAGGVIQVTLRGPSGP